ncbi:DC-STAMP domain-containing protein 2-like [Drosophila albomicans]|uniref:DC-STAMP domain-containing protein 2-like n=1 Tax=Drosophila albomicans TaxID=7291 RepID=A0A6P8XBN1_DROAB|nr:DC-STAMP domain-containing protein 2-like [Drosophila albomicans]
MSNISAAFAWPLKLMIPLIVAGYLTSISLILLCYDWQPVEKLKELSQNWLLMACLGIVCIILIYSRPMRCIFVLALPSLSSSRGRALLITLAFFVAALGPSANIMANLRIMLQSLDCGQQLLRQAIGQLLDVLLEPIKTVQSAVGLMLDEVRRVLRQVMDLLLSIQSYLLFFIDTFKSCSSWLKSVAELCNSQRGSPGTRCQRAAERVVIKCRENFVYVRSLCYATRLYMAVCLPVMLFDVFCVDFWSKSWNFMDSIMERYYEFVAQLEQMFDASISFKHNFNFHTNASKNLSDVSEQILQDITQSLRPFRVLQSCLDLLCWVLLLLVFVNAAFFYLQYMQSRSYQNVYLTSDFYAIEQQFRLQGRRRVLPLKCLERCKYLKLSSPRLTSCECLLLAEHAFLLLISCVQLFAICVVDYSLFWLLASISYYGRQQAELELPAYIELEIKQGGFMGDIMRGIANAFRPLTQQRSLNTQTCLPLPLRPNYRKYLEIFQLCLLAWLILLTEPFVLRLRHVIMQHFHPERAKIRAIYLHQKILKERANFFKMPRRQARAAFSYHTLSYRSSCFNWLHAKLCCCCHFLWPRCDVCVLCGKLLSSSPRINCDSPGCQGIFCQLCFSASNNRCNLCQRSLDCDDCSVISEIQDSSDDPDVVSYGQQQTKLYCGK